MGGTRVAPRRATCPGCAPNDGLEQRQVLLRVYPLYQRYVQRVSLALREVAVRPVDTKHANKQRALHAPRSGHSLTTHRPGGVGVMERAGGLRPLAPMQTRYGPLGAHILHRTPAPHRLVSGPRPPGAAAGHFAWRCRVAQAVAESGVTPPTWYSPISSSAPVPGKKGCPPHSCFRWKLTHITLRGVKGVSRVGTGWGGWRLVVRWCGVRLGGFLGLAALWRSLRAPELACRLAPAQGAAVHGV